MTQAHIQFKKLIQDSQTYESFDVSDDHMVSRIVFDLEVAGGQYPNMVVEVSQPYGTRYEIEPLEVGRPIGPYKGPWNHSAFSEHCERYYRRLVGQSGSSIRIEEGASNTRMWNNTVVREMQATIELPEAGSEAW